MPSRSLPLFPLPLVLFPGAPLPLHVFEPRYRALLADCERGDRRFGVIRTTGGPERALPPGHVGCIAQLRDVEMLPDGRANVIVEGIERFALESFVDAPQPYHVALVTPYPDYTDDAADALDAVAERVRVIFRRVAQAARTIADDASPVPELSDDPALLAFRIASMVDFDDDDRQALLASRSPLERLRHVETLLIGAVVDIERRAAAHGRASSNGHGPHADGGA